MRTITQNDLRTILVTILHFLHPEFTCRNTIAVSKLQNLMFRFTDAHAQRIFFTGNALGFIFQVYDMQTFKSLFKFFQQVPGIILAIVIHYNHFMRTWISLGKCTRKISSQVCGFITGADDYTYRMLLGLLPGWFAKKSQSLEKPGIIHNLNKTNKA